MNTTRDQIVTLLSTSKPLKGLAIAKKLGVHSVSYLREIDPVLGKLELDGVIEDTASGAYKLTARAVEIGKRYGFSGLRAVDTY